MDIAPAGPNKNTQAQVDTILYLASFASQPKDVDPLLDKLRQLTAARGSIEFYTDADRQKLQGIQQELETYLVEKESLRGFTHESLARRLAQRNQQAKEPAPSLLLPAIWIISVTAAVVSFLLTRNLIIDQRLGTSIPMFYVAIFAGSAWLCFTAIKDFKPELRRPYFMFALGIGTLGVSLLYTAVRTMTGHTQAHWQHLEITMFPYILGMTAIYVGMRAFALALSVHSWAIARRYVVSASLLAAIVAVLLPHAETQVQELYYDISVIILAIIGVLSIAGSTVMYAIARSVNNLYAKPMRWLLAGFVTISISLWNFMIMRFVEPEAAAGLWYVSLFLPIVVGGLLILKASVEFNKTTRH